MKKLLSFVIVAMMVVSLVAPAFALTSAPAAHDPAENWLSIWIEDTEIDVSATTEVSVYVDVSNNVNGFEYLKFFIFYPECLTLTKTTGAGFVASSEVTTGLESKTANKGLRDAFDTLGLDPADYLDGHTKFTSPYLDVLRSDEADEDADCFDNGRIVCFKFTYDPELNPDGNDIEIRMFNSPDDQLHVSKPGYEYDDEFVNVEVYGGKIVVKNQGIGGGPSYENATLEVEDVTINKGDATAKFNINIYNNPGFYSCPILFIYDDDASFSDFTAGVASASAFPLSPKKADNAGLRDMDSASANAKYKWLTAALTAEGIDATGKLMTYFSVENNELVNITGDGVLFSVTLDTSALDAGTYDIGIVYSAANTIDEDYNDVKFDLVQGTLTVVGSECPHAHTENVNIVTPATCTTPATHDVKCTDCGEIIETGVVDTAALGHDYQETAEDTYLKEAATCTSPAVYFKSCSRCHEMSEETFTSGTSLGHDYQETAEDTYLKEAATCTEPAVYFKSCSRCHALSEETFTSGSALGHDFQDVVDEAYLKDAVSCTAPATYYKSCSRCHALSEETFTTGSALGHAYEQTAVTGNCGEAGTVTYTCSRCGDTYDDPVAEIPHNFTLENAVPEAIKTAASCDDPAVYYKTCSRCGAISTNDDDTFTYGDALGHDFQAIAEDPYIKTAATCTEPAVYFKSCSRCHTLSDETFTSGSALGHDFQETVEDAYLKAAATCTEPAVYFKSCSRCHALSEDTFTFGEALGHNHEAVVTDPTCTEQGYTTHTCSRCGDTFVDTYTDPLGHDHVAVVTDPTCTEQGYTTHTCSRCGDTFVDTYTDPLGHDHIAVVTDPTCTEKGYTTHTCSRCGDTFVDTYIDELGHDWDEGVNVDPTCEAPGGTLYTCKRCGETKLEDEIPALGHDWEVVKETAPTCDHSGSIEYVCKNDASHTKVEILEPLEHQWDEGKVTKQPTETEEGVFTYTCKLCGATKTEAIPKLTPTTPVNPGEPDNPSEPTDPGTGAKQTGDNIATLVFISTIAAVSGAAIIVAKKKIFDR